MPNKKTLKKVINTSNKTSLGLDQNLASALAYAVGWVTGLIFLFTEKDNKLVRFHAMQSVVVFGFFNVLLLIPAVGFLLSPFIAILSFVLWLVAMLKAYQGEKFHLPIAGDFAEKQLKKLS